VSPINIKVAVNDICGPNKCYNEHTYIYIEVVPCLCFIVLSVKLYCLKVVYFLYLVVAIENLMDIVVEFSHQCESIECQNFYSGSDRDYKHIILSKLVKIKN